MVDVLFVNPPSPNNSVYIRDINRSGRKSREKIIWPQTSLAYLAAMVDDKHTVAIVDCIAEDMKWDKFEDMIKKYQPKYFIGNVITSSLHNDMKAISIAKKYGAKTIVIGPHVTELPKDSLEKFKDIDYAVIGEGEYTIKELIESVDESKELDNVKGIALRKGEKIIVTERRPLIENLDNLPVPRQDLLPINKYVFPFIADKFTFVMSSRGCPYFCTYCRQPIMWKRKVRSRSAESIMKELRMLKKLGVNNFSFHSDTFTINKEIVLELCEKMVNEKLNMHWFCNSRVDTIDEEMIISMKKAGCWMVAYGIESGSQEVLDKVKKGATLEQAVKTVNITREHGIKSYGYFIIGLPGETKETIRETIDFSKKLSLSFAIFHVASPYPGTEFYEQCINNNWLEISKWEDINQGGECPMNYPNLSNKEIMKGIKTAYKEWYFRPRIVLGVLREIKNFSDLKHLINIAINHLGWK